jgi:hypothetical protein
MAIAFLALSYARQQLVVVTLHAMLSFGALGYQSGTERMCCCWVKVMWLFVAVRAVRAIGRIKEKPGHGSSLALTSPDS